MYYKIELMKEVFTTYIRIFQKFPTILTMILDIRVRIQSYILKHVNETGKKNICFTFYQF